MGLAHLRTLFGDRYVETAAIRQQHGGGEGFRGNHAPDAVLYAESTEDVALAVHHCANHRLPVIPFGVGTSLEGQVEAIHGGLCIDLSRMDKVLTVSADDLDCRVEAGVTREQLNAEIKGQGLFFPLDPGANATLGGMAATRASRSVTCAVNASMAACSSGVSARICSMSAARSSINFFNSAISFMWISFESENKTVAAR